jgi:hypothetical protein
MFGVANSRTRPTQFALMAHTRSTDFQEFIDRDITRAYAETHQE